MSARSESDSDSAASPAKTTLPSHLLHDLRSPLNQIIGYSEMLSEEVDGEPSESLVADLDKIRAAGHRILALIDHHFVSDTELSRAIPTDENEEVAAPDSSLLKQRPPLEPGHLLVVDDDPSNRDVLSRRLRREGHVVEAAGSGRDALECVRNTAFDLVLLDIMMPEMDGYEVLRLMKADERLHHIPVIMISALNEEQSVVRCIEAGAEDYLTKPFNPTLLRARIGACLEKKRGRDRETLLFDQLGENYKRLQVVEELRDDMRNMIVHDLRTPLTAVILGVDMLEKHGDLNPAQREMMAIAAGGGKTLLGMVNDLLDVEKMASSSTKLQYEELSPDSLVAGAIEQVCSLAEGSDTRLVSDVTPGLPFLQGDENKLSRTLVNLIANAIKFTPSGSVTISVFMEGDDFMRFAVRDTGEGIPPEAFERIFEKFGQVGSSKKVGTGLGLAFCKLAVEAHGGRIKVESTPGVGSTFSFTIPLLARDQ
ncbi:MAG TPA: response regulator [Thermoanaerobaculia bacterium]|nr:response regulator [Thermoanaerobaculia bacterium]